MERLNMTQPPLSRQIQKLERAVGVPSSPSRAWRTCRSPGGWTPRWSRTSSG
ncbi:MAG TPA: LysR family transcriptional regulator [Streptosporangiaceae bacterium]